jgi:cobalt-zinc-cadmium resistance protein CzcA
MHTFITFLMRQRWFVITATLLLCLAGWVAWTRLPIDAFPDVTNV